MPRRIGICDKIAFLIVAICLFNLSYLLKINTKADPSVTPDININEEESMKTNKPGSDHSVTPDININEEKSMKTNQPGLDYSVTPHINIDEKKSMKTNQPGSEADESKCKLKCRFNLRDPKAFAGCNFDFLPQYEGACRDARIWAVFLYLLVACIMIVCAIVLFNKDDNNDPY